MDTKEYYDEVSKGYDAARHTRYHDLADKIAVREALDAWDGKGLVLEAGCGTGRVMSKLKENGPAVLGIDLSLGMLRSARAKGLAVAQAEIEKLPVKPGSLDMICCFKVLPHVSDLEAALRSMSGAVRPGGRIVVEAYNPTSLRGFVKRLIGPGRIVERVDEGDVYTRYDRIEDLERVGAGVGLELEKVRGYRILTPAAAFLELPVLGALLERLELFLSKTVAARGAGFTILTFRRPDRQA